MHARFSATPVFLAAFVCSCAISCAGRWSTKEGCELLPNEANDGDSFHVKHRGHEFIYRLYFVDAPEADESLPDRVREQADYFGITDVKDVIKAGQEAREFTARFLRNGFTVVTKGEDARGRSELAREFAFVSVGSDDLAVELVRAGFARIYGEQEQEPDGPSIQIVRQQLKTAEREAKAAKRGAWAHGDPDGIGRAKVPGARSVAGQELELPRSIPYYSLIDGRSLGVIPIGTKILVLKEESSSMLRLRFLAKPGTYYEVQCRRADLNL